eukprot:1191592-Alexandrium_andersonii.AAC.1
MTTLDEQTLQQALQAVQQAQAAAQAAQQQSAGLHAQMQQMVQQQQAQAAQQTAVPADRPPIDPKTATKPEIFSGEDRQWPEFAFCFSNYIGLLNSEMAEQLGISGRMADPINFDTLSEKNKAMSRSLFQLLSTQCKGKARRILMSVSNGCGFESWRLLRR